MEETSWVTGSSLSPSSPTHKFTSQLFFQLLLHPIEECVENNISLHLYLLVNRSLPPDLENFVFIVCNVTLDELGCVPEGGLPAPVPWAWVSHQLFPLCWPDGEGVLQIRLGSGQAEGRA